MNTLNNDRLHHPGPPPRPRPSTLLLLASLAGWLLASGNTLAQSSATSISFQGVLNGANGQALPNGSYTLGFQFWNHPTSTAASNRVGSSATVPGVAVNGGVASTAIPVQPEWFDGRTRYLGIAVDGGSELLPRVLVTGVPHALLASCLAGASDANPTNVNGNLVVPGFVGVGRVPRAPIDVFCSSGVAVRSELDSLQSPFSYSGFAHRDLLLGAYSYNGVYPLHLLSFGYRQDPGYLFCIGSANSPDFSSASFAASFTVTSDGRVGIGTTDPQARFEVLGTTRTTVLQITSAREAKQDFAPVDAAAILAKVAALPLSTWVYTNAPTVRHLGPVAQDFHAAFGLSDDDQHIATVDADGVALAAIQGLNQKLENQIRDKDARIAALEERLARLERHLPEHATRE